MTLKNEDIGRCILGPNRLPLTETCNETKRDCNETKYAMTRLLFVFIVICIITNYIYCYFHLELDINECISNPCLNGGNCTDQVNGFTCSCVPGFSGTRCETGYWLYT